MSGQLTCPDCGVAGQMVGVEYHGMHPEHYDGISEWKCRACGVRHGRWTGRVLTGDETEPRFGEQRPRNERAWAAWRKWLEEHQ